MAYVLLLANNWWSLALRGLLSISLGVVTLFWPGITLTALVILFGAFAFADGVVNLVGAWRASRGHEKWGALLLEGLAGIIVAGVTVFFPIVTAFALVYLVAAWALVTGVLEIAAAVRLREHIAHEWLLGLAGAFSLLFGILLIAAPVAGAFAIALWIGIYCLVFGIVMVALGFRVRSWGRTISSGGVRPIGNEAGPARAV